MLTEPEPDATTPRCRFCAAALMHTFVDLGMSPLCESYVAWEDRNRAEIFYPLHAFVCERCFLVQLDEYVAPAEIFREYAYFSSYSESWLDHARRYVQSVVHRFDLGPHSKVIEVASNDGYLLQYFLELGIPVLGIEPATNVAQVAIERGIDTMVEFFDLEFATRLVDDGMAADLLIANNVLAQVTDLNDFVAGIRQVLGPLGVATFEFPHLVRLVEGNEFDTIYHEHFSYFSFSTIERIFAAHGLTVFDVEELTTHGGSLRVYACRDGAARSIEPAVQRVRSAEQAAGVEDLDYYSSFTERVERVRLELLQFLIDAKRAGARVVAYGAPGKGNTLLNYCGVRADLLPFTVDRNPYKQGKLLPGTHIPIYHPDRLFDAKPDYILLLPWNLEDEIVEQLAPVRDWGGRFVVAIPEVRVLP
jgi:SAM-dependent methyltransferase